MEKHIILSTLGNRDIQFTKKDQAKLPEKLRNYLTENTEDRDFLCLKKEFEEKPFKELAKEFDNYYDEIQPWIQYPMIEQAIQDTVGEKDTLSRVILIPTGEENNHKFDTYAIGDILQKKINKDYNIEVEVRPIKNAKNPSTIFSLFEDIINENLAEDPQQKITFHVSGGLPESRFYAMFAVLFKDRVTIKNFIGGENLAIQSFQMIEGQIIRKMVKGMLDNYNYSAILHIKKIPKEVQELSHLAIARLALDFERARAHKDSLKTLDPNFTLSHPLPSSDKETEKIGIEVVYSAYIKYKQQEYADFLFRLFTFRENMLKPIVENILGGYFEFNKKDQHKQWNKLLKEERNKELLRVLENSKVGENALRYEEPNMYTYRCIVDHSTNPELNNYMEFLDIFNKLEALSNLRNLAAHTYTRISLENIETIKFKGKKKIQNFIDDLLNTNFDTLPPYKEINEKILDYLK